MGLYEACYQILVDDGPLSGLFLYRLPPRQVHDVDVAFVPISGVGGTRAFGARDVSDGPTGVTHDGGIQYWHTGTQYHLRAKDPDDPAPAASAADDIRDVLAQFAGGDDEYAEETIVRCDITSAPYFFAQDERGRPIAALAVECWHRPVRG